MNTTQIHIRYLAYIEHYYTKFQSDHYYHVYNRSIDGKPMFKNDGNYAFFLKRMYYYLSPVLKFYAYCLLNNHFHLFVKIRDLTILEIPKSKSDHETVSFQFRKLFQSYALAFNNQQGRTGGLFQTPFKRAQVDSEAYFSYLIYYIHHNPQIHNFVSDFKKWKWSSYHEIISQSSTQLQRDEILEWYGGKEEFIKYHSGDQNSNVNTKMFLDED